MVQLYKQASHYFDLVLPYFHMNPATNRDLKGRDRNAKSTAFHYEGTAFH